MSGISAARALSFGAVPEDYERYRPGPSPAVLDWLLPAHARAAVDVGAGTGALTRLLVERLDVVTAVEPDARMRSVLVDRVPDAVACAGAAEALPVGDGTQDAVLASSSWHWVDPSRAVPEAARVLRSGGRLGVVWTSMDRDAAWVRDLWQALRPRQEGPVPVRGPRALVLPDGLVDIDGGGVGRGGDNDGGAAHERPDGERPFHAARGSRPFRAAQGPHLVRFSRRFTLDELVGLAGTYSGLIVQPPDERAALLGDVRRTLTADPRFSDPAGVDVPMLCRCWRADRR